MKKYIFLLSFLLSGCSFFENTKPLEPISFDIQKNIDEIKENQISLLLKSKKYKQQKTQEIDGITYTVNEYKRPDGKIGYRIYMTKEVEGVSYFQEYHVSPEGESYTNWEELIIDDNNEI